jgi:hypothetical protein
MRRQALFVAPQMLDGVRTRHPLGEAEYCDEKDVTQLKHRFSLSVMHYMQMAKLLAQSA